MNNLFTKKHMLLCNFNAKLEADIRKKFDVGPEVQVTINWSEDGSCVWSIAIGDVQGVFSFLDYNYTEGLLLEFFDAKDVQMLEEYYFPDNESHLAFEEYKKSVGITDPEIDCAAHMPEEYMQGWQDLYNQRAIVEIELVTKEEKSDA